MPRTNFKVINIHYTFEVGFQKNWAIALCKKAQKKQVGLIGGVIAEYSVFNENIDGVSRVVAEFSSVNFKIGAQQLKELLLEVMKETYDHYNFHVLKRVLDLVLDKVKGLDSYELDEVSTRYIDKYVTRLDVIGKDIDRFMNDIHSFFERFYFKNIPQILAVMIMSQMECKLPKEELTILDCGSSCFVIPEGPNADKFYEEFDVLRKNLAVLRSPFPGYNGEELIEGCRLIEKMSVYFFIYDQDGQYYIEFRGFEENVKKFAEMIPEHLELYRKIKKERIALKEKSERKSPSVIFRRDSDELIEVLEGVTFGEN